MNGRAAGAATGYALRVTSSANRTTDYQNINLHNLTHTTDRFAMGLTETRMRASGLRWLLRVSDRANVRAMNADVIALDMVRDWRFETEKRLRHATRFLSDQHEFDGAPMDSPRGAEQRAVVDPHHEPTGCASAQLSGDLCGSRALRAPQETGESLGSPFLW